MNFSLSVSLLLVLIYQIDYAKCNDMDDNSTLRNYAGGTFQKLTHLPAEVAEQVKAVAIHASWHTANYRFGYYGDATNNKILFHRYADSLKVIAKDLGISAATVENVQWGCWSAAWHTANSRSGLFGWHPDAARDKASFNNYYQKVKNGGEMAESLVENIKWMSWYTAWHAANYRAGYHQDSKSDKYTYEEYFRKIKKDAVMVSITFDERQRKLTNVKMLMLVEKKIENNSNLVQTTAYKLKRSKTKTSSWEKKFGFKIGVTASFGFGFKFLTLGNVEISVETSYEHTWGETETTTKEETYLFPLQVAPHSTVWAKATIHEAQVEIPYQMVYQIGDVQRSFTGTWKGVGYSKIRVQIAGEGTSVESDVIGNLIEDETSPSSAPAVYPMTAAITVIAILTQQICNKMF